MMDIDRTGTEGAATNTNRREGTASVRLALL
jgi:hypothetical protein